MKIDTYEKAYATYGDKPIPAAVAMSLPLQATGGARNKAVCAMQMAAWMAGEPHTDHPACTSPSIATYVIELNDIGAQPLRDALSSRIPVLVHTANAMLEDARLFAMLKAIIVNLNEAFTHVEGGDRFELAPFMEKLNAAILTPRTPIEIDFPEVNDNWRSPSLREGDYADLIRTSLYMLDWDGFDENTGATMMRVIDIVFGTPWYMEANVDPNKPQPAARGLVVLDTMMGVDKPL